jgi:hypothetical protein
MGEVVTVDLSSGRHYCYAMLCRDEDGPLYVKFGRTDHLGQRLSQLRSNCPIPAKWFGVVELRNHILQGMVERSLHRHFKERQTKGEWFKFDADLPEDKEAFNQGCRKCFADCNIPDHWWSKISVPALDRYARQRQREYLNKIGSRQSVEEHNKRLARGRAKAREYKSYRGL